MKVFHYLPKNIGSFAIFSILLTACVNHISEENEAIIADGNIPLKFVTDIHELINTRIVGNSFEEEKESVYSHLRVPLQCTRNAM